MARRAGFLEGLDMAEADFDAELIALVEDGLGVGGPGLQGAGEDDPAASCLQVGGWDGVSRQAVSSG